MFNVVLVAPEIPPNTGNVIRLCANTGARLHLVRPLGFSLDDKQLRRAGLDYHEYASVKVHASFPEFIAEARPDPERTFALTTRGQRSLFGTPLRSGDWFVFGAETSGLPEGVRAWFCPEHDLRLPMRAASRSLNLSNAVAIVVYEAWRQSGFADSI
ncbi:MAG TPA: tRNA (uridine(34)/cytosine(34)/5-carboxymethylaminomethyluridine(34)-2'-O)-methyltransferase TrmL [Burkholderiaceae bacterium]|nr:tRNA (uridine(34)/cytosine(34)/5-carboxymethylaminomethyluridine(34)-2'-O)-methyltransferase TrmL [Burkholderiaceae bacterium]